MRLLCLSLTITVILMSGLFGPKFKEQKTGPFAVTYWRDKGKNYDRSSAEIEEFMQQFDKKVANYISKNPQRPEWIRENLLAGETTIGMTKEEILLLLDEPAKKEPVFDYGADEKWVYITYRPYGEDHLYFKGDTVIKILGFQTGNVL